jgi:hypothetical protein
MYKITLREPNTITLRGVPFDEGVATVDTLSAGDASYFRQLGATVTFTATARPAPVDDLTPTEETSADIVGAPQPMADEPDDETDGTDEPDEATAPAVRV